MPPWTRGSPSSRTTLSTWWEVITDASPTFHRIANLSKTVQPPGAGGGDESHEALDSREHVEAVGQLPSQGVGIRFWGGAKETTPQYSR